MALSHKTGLGVLSCQQNSRYFIPVVPRFPERPLVVSPRNIREGAPIAWSLLKREGEGETHVKMCLEENSGAAKIC